MTFANRISAARYADVCRWYFQKREVLARSKRIKYNFPEDVALFDETRDVGCKLRQFVEAFLVCVNDGVPPTNTTIKTLNPRK